VSEVKKLRLGLVGKDVSKSDSGKIHAFILQELGYDLEYENVSASVEEFDDVVRYLMGDFDGFNVTIPYKRDIMEYLDEVVGDAALFGAVNTVVSATRTGYNTDGLGFMQMLKLFGVTVFEKKVLILGAGGAGRSCAAVLKNAGADVALYRRNRTELLEICGQLGVSAAVDPERGGYDIIVNSTGVGMHDSVGVSPVSEKAFCGASIAVDLIYRPKRSEFLRLAEGLGLKIVSGEAMLFLQAYYADCYFLKKTPCEAEAENLYKRYLDCEELL
jgi:shikimate dehydrogenase